MACNFCYEVLNYSLQGGSSLTIEDNQNGHIKLSQREIEVLSLIAQGHSSQEAADVLFVSKRTVDFHLANVYDKLQVNNRVQAFRVAARLGFMTL